MKFSWSFLFSFLSIIISAITAYLTWVPHSKFEGFVIGVSRNFPTCYSTDKGKQLDVDFLFSNSGNRKAVVIEARVIAIRKDGNDVFAEVDYSENFPFIMQPQDLKELRISLPCNDKMFVDEGDLDKIIGSITYEISFTTADYRGRAYYPKVNLIKINKELPVNVLTVFGGGLGFKKVNMLKTE